MGVNLGLKHDEKVIYEHDDDDADIRTELVSIEVIQRLPLEVLEEGE